MFARIKSTLDTGIYKQKMQGIALYSPYQMIIRWYFSTSCWRLGWAVERREPWRALNCHGLSLLWNKQTEGPQSVAAGRESAQVQELIKFWFVHSFANALNFLASVMPVSSEMCIFLDCFELFFVVFFLLLHNESLLWFLMNSLYRYL